MGSYSAEVYGEIVKHKLNHNNNDRPKNWIALKSGNHKGISCAYAASIYLQRKGCLDKNEIISHTKRTGKPKKTRSLAIQNWKALKNCEVVYFGRTISHLPKKYKKRGIVFVYDSDIAVYQHDNLIYSCSLPGVQSWYKVGHTHGYQFTHPILWIIVPNDLREKE